MKTMSRTVLWVAGAAVAVGLVIAGVLAATQSPEMLDEGTPEGIAQRYVQAMFDGNETEAATYLTDDLRDRCNLRPDAITGDDRRARAVFLGTERDGDQAFVDVEIIETYGSSPFDSGEYSFETTLTLTQNDGSWAISEVPWPLYHCPEGRR